MFKFEKNKSFFKFMEDVKTHFTSKTVCADLQAKCMEHDLTGALPDILSHFAVFYKAAISLISVAAAKVQGVNQGAVDSFMEEIQVGDKTQSMFKTCVQDLNHGLTFYTEESKTKFWLKTPYIDYDYIFNLLQYSFFAIVLLDAQAYRRFYAAYTLWQNMIEIDYADINDDKYVFNKLTCFGKNNIFYVKPITGEIYKLDINSFKGLRGKSIEKFSYIWHGGEEFLCAVLIDGSLVKLYNRTQKEFCGELKMQGKYRKKSEGGKPWLSFHLGEDFDPTINDRSNFYLLNHTMIALSIYGLDVMKFAIMDYLSIFTIDHINGKYDDNRINNLRLITADANVKLEHNKSVVIFDFFKYWGTAVKAGYKNQDNLDYRRKIGDGNG